MRHGSQHSSAAVEIALQPVLHRVECPRGILHLTRAFLLELGLPQIPTDTVGCARQPRQRQGDAACRREQRDGHDDDQQNQVEEQVAREGCALLRASQSEDGRVAVRKANRDVVDAIGLIPILEREQRRDRNHSLASDGGRHQRTARVPGRGGCDLDVEPVAQQVQQGLLEGVLDFGSQGKGDDGRPLPLRGRERRIAPRTACHRARRERRTRPDRIGPHRPVRAIRPSAVHRGSLSVRGPVGSGSPAHTRGPIAERHAVRLSRRGQRAPPALCRQRPAAES